MTQDTTISSEDLKPHEVPYVRRQYEDKALHYKGMTHSPSRRLGIAKEVYGMAHRLWRSNLLSSGELQEWGQELKEAADALERHKASKA